MALDPAALTQIENETPGIIKVETRLGETTVEVDPAQTLNALRFLKETPGLAYAQLIDLCGVDLTAYGQTDPDPDLISNEYAIVYHLMSIKFNRRIRVFVRLTGEMPAIDSAVSIWSVANWFEREVFDLFGVLFHGHPDLRRILTDYGFIGHPFRKDFPLSGHVEMRYDDTKRRVVYEPVTIDPRVTVPRTIREDGFGGRDT